MSEYAKPCAVRRAPGRPQEARLPSGEWPRYSADEGRS